MEQPVPPVSDSIIGLDEAGALNILLRSAFALAVDDRVERSSFGSKPNVSTGPLIDNVSAGFITI